MSINDKDLSRVNRTDSEARSFYDGLSRWYDLLSGRSEYKINRIGLEKLDINQQDTVLEIGYGTGKILSDILNLVGSERTVYGIDLSEGMRKRTLLRLGENLKSRVSLSLGNAKTLPYNDNMFDKIYMSFTLELFDTPDIWVVLKEAFRVLKKGGKICVISLLKRDKRIVNIYEWLHNKFPKAIDCRPILPELHLKEANYSIKESDKRTIFGLPVNIVIAQKRGDITPVL